MIFKIELLPARYGDCIWITYGTLGNMRQILIDGGTRGTRSEIIEKIVSLPKEERKLELLVVTHIDQDHLQGIQAFLEQDQLGVEIKDFWFNGWKHLPTDDVEEFGARQAENMTKEILRHRLAWNHSFNGKAVFINKTAPLPVVTLPGGLRLTLLAPTLKALRELRPVWEREIKKAGLVPGFGSLEQPLIDDNIEAFGSVEPDVNGLNNEPFKEDESEANASSIAFLAEFEGKRALFLGDSLPSQVQSSLRLLQPSGKFKVDLVKVSHHASSGNTSPELIEMLDCKRFAISTNGSIYRHPKPVTIARLIKRAGPGVELIFNYRSKANEIWDSTSLKTLHNYKTTYLSKGEIVNIGDDTVGQT